VTSPDASLPYASNVTGYAQGSTSILAEGIMGGTSACSATVPVNVSANTLVISVSDIVLNGTGDSANIIVSVISGTPTQVDFSSGDTSIAVFTTPDTTPPTFTSVVTATGIGTTTFTATATDASGITSSVTANVTVNNPAAWTQAGAGDIIAGTGNVSTQIPSVCALPGCDPSLITFTSSQNPGVVQAGGTSITDGTVPPPYNSQPPFNWLVVNNQYNGQIYDYAFFEGKSTQIPFYSGAPASVTSPVQLKAGGTYKGYYWVKYTGGDMSIDANINIGTDKIILMVENGDLNINGRINLTPGRGLFMTVVNGDINVNGTVGGPADGNPELEGLYFANGTFSSASAAGTYEQLHCRGSVVAGNFSLTNRSLIDNSQDPANFFEYSPSLLLQVPASLGARQVVWREVAP